MRADPHNHTVALLDLIHDDESEHDILIMTVLRDFNDPPFEFVDEIIDFVKQTLEARNSPNTEGSLISPSSFYRALFSSIGMV